MALLLSRARQALELELARKDHSLQVLQETLRKKDELIR